MVHVTVKEGFLTKDNLLGVWHALESRFSPEIWSALMKGTRIPENESESEVIRLREELRKRGHFNEVDLRKKQPEA